MTANAPQGCPLSPAEQEIADQLRFDRFRHDLNAKLGAILEDHVEPIFKRGALLTLIARTPGNDDADVLVTSDSLDEIAKLVERSKARPEVR
jgi:hypothetical protein